MCMCRGFAGAAALLSFYAAPLATLIKIIKSRDASSLDPRLAIMMFINMVMWLSYGLVSPDFLQRHCVAVGLHYQPFWGLWSRHIV